MASMRRTIARAMTRDPKMWRRVEHKPGENRNERRQRAHSKQQKEK